MRNMDIWLVGFAYLFMVHPLIGYVIFLWDIHRFPDFAETISRISDKDRKDVDMDWLSAAIYVLCMMWPMFFYWSWQARRRKHHES